MEGTMLWFNSDKRYGFIHTDEGERLRVEQEGLARGQLLGARCRGTRVSFDRADDPVKEARAVNVAVVPVLAARRARWRGHR